MWSTYLSGRAVIRLFASASISSRSPNRSASAGQALTQAGVEILSRNPLLSIWVSGAPLRAVATGWLTRSAQCVHFSILGARESHCAVGTSHGQASMQYRQPMHLSAL